MKKFLLIPVALMLASCTDSGATIRAAQEMGFTDVKVTGYRYFGCGEGYTFSTGFEATNPKGQRISGYNCSGFLRGSNIHLD